jgi:hypothetical protein
MKIFGREPAVWLGFATSALALLAAYVVHLSTDQQGAIVAVIAGVLGLATAVIVRDGIVAAVLGLAQVVLSLGLAFGAHIDAGHQALIMAFVASAVSMFVRTQVIAPVPAAAIE